MNKLRLALALLGFAALSACGGGGDGGSTPPPSGNPPPPTIPASYVRLTSDAGDWVGGGNSYSYSQADAIFTVTAEGGHLMVTVAGDESWLGHIQLPNTYASLQAGTYSGLTAYPFNDAALGGLIWGGQGRNCSTVTGSVTITKAVYSGSALSEVSLQFTQYCNGSSGALHGEIYWNANDTTKPPGPTTPPAGLWQPAAGTTPATGNYVYLEGQAGDPLASGTSFLYTQANSVLSASLQATHLSVGINGDQQWGGDFLAMSSVAQFVTGYYGGLQRYLLNNPTRPGLNWSGNGHICNTISGWFVIDAIVTSGGALQSIDLRFEQHCDGASAVLHGKIHWDANDPTVPPGPATPPAGLWQPAAGITPASGNYIYLESEAGDNMGQGLNYLYTQANSTITAATAGPLFSLDIKAFEHWTGSFLPMNSLARLQPGYYGDIGRYPANNPATGGLYWSIDYRGCNVVSGWFVVDGVTYDGVTVKSVDLRFEQHCEGVAAALHGKIHWDASDTTSPPGPVSPPPAGLWQPAAGITPASGNYIYLESQVGDPFGYGASYLYTQANAVLTVGMQGPGLAVGVDGYEHWTGGFQGMNFLSRLEPGYYGDLQGGASYNPVKGVMGWSGQGIGCNTNNSWFVVDSVTYSGTTLTSIDLRFEQHCDGAAPALHGKIHWDASDTTTPAGPVSPPAGLWQPAAGITPASGNYVYLESQPGDFIGQGNNFLYTAADTTFQFVPTATRFSMFINSGAFWSGDFQAMYTLAQLQPGYYGNVDRYPSGNPAVGDMEWNGNGHACDAARGWFVVDSVTYTGATMTAIDLRFEQHCDGAVPALHGKIHWGP